MNDYIPVSYFDEILAERSSARIDIYDSPVLKIKQQLGINSRYARNPFADAM